jgi:hypothetical protein
MALAAIRINLYSHSACSLCIPVKYVASRVASRHGIPFSVVDITKDETLNELYQYRIPVVTLEGEGDYSVLFEPTRDKNCIDEEEFTHVLRAKLNRRK